MIVKAYQTAFHREGEVKIRQITIPDEEVPEAASEENTQALLERAFYYGQNDFQPVQGFYSVSVGDVVELNNGQRFRVLGAGWEELDADEDPTVLLGQNARDQAYGVL